MGLGAVVKQEPTTDERAGMNWWNSLSELERSQVLVAAGWKSGAAWTPSAADAWAYHKMSRGQEDSTMIEPPVHVDLDLPPSAALALAQFAKCVTWKEMRDCAVDDAEAYEIRAAVDTPQKALAEAGYAPR
jgi:hypothetical protein